MRLSLVVSSFVFAPISTELSFESYLSGIKNSSSGPRGHPIQDTFHLIPFCPPRTLYEVLLLTTSGPRSGVLHVATVSSNASSRRRSHTTTVHTSTFTEFDCLPWIKEYTQHKMRCNEWRHTVMITQACKRSEFLLACTRIIIVSTNLMDKLKQNTCWF